MLSSLLAAGIWLLVASKYGWPVSTTHSIIGAIVGFAVVGISSDSVMWGQVLEIVASWVVSPVFSGTISFFLVLSVQKLVLDTDDPLKNAQRYVPYYIFLVGFVIAMVTLVKGLSHVGLEVTFNQATILALAFGLVTVVIGTFMLRGLNLTFSDDHEEQMKSVERVFGVLMI